MPDPMTERSEILKQLDSAEFKDRRGNINVPAVIKEVYVNSVIAQRRLAEGRTAMQRCPILKGEKTFEEVHSGPSLRNTPPPRNSNSGPDTLNVHGKVRVKTIILIILAIALIATGGTAAAVHLFGV
jgi:hypothetical protein